MTRECARWVDGRFCGRPFVVSRTITVMTAATAVADLEYLIDLCEAHAAEHDRDAL